MWNPYFYWYFRLNLQILIQKKNPRALCVSCSKRYN